MFRSNLNLQHSPSNLRDEADFYFTQVIFAICRSWSWLGLTWSCLVLDTRSLGSNLISVKAVMATPIFETWANRQQPCKPQTVAVFSDRPFATNVFQTTTDANQAAWIALCFMVCCRHVYISFFLFPLLSTGNTPPFWRCFFMLEANIPVHAFSGNTVAERIQTTLQQQHRRKQGGQDIKAKSGNNSQSPSQPAEMCDPRRRISENLILNYAKWPFAVLKGPFPGAKSWALPVKCVWESIAFGSIPAASLYSPSPESHITMSQSVKKKKKSGGVTAAEQLDISPSTIPYMQTERGHTMQR